MIVRKEKLKIKISSTYQTDSIQPGLTSDPKHRNAVHRIWTVRNFTFICGIKVFLPAPVMWLCGVRYALLFCISFDVRRCKCEQFDVQLAGATLQSPWRKDILRRLHSLHCSSLHDVRYAEISIRNCRREHYTNTGFRKESQQWETMLFTAVVWTRVSQTFRAQIYTWMNEW